MSHKQYNYHKLALITFLIAILTSLFLRVQFHIFTITIFNALFRLKDI